LANGQAKRFTLNADDAGEERTVLPKNDVPLAATVKEQPSESILSKPEIFTEIEYVKDAHLYAD
jgi:hypothetical protein